MAQGEKQLLLKDLCARLLYGVICKLSAKGANVSITEKLNLGGLEHFIFGTMDVRPYLRPMSSMTEEERKHFESMCCWGKWESGPIITLDAADWLNANHFDYRDLIESGLAIKAPEDMYKTE